MFVISSVSIKFIVSFLCWASLIKLSLHQVDIIHVNISMQTHFLRIIQNCTDIERQRKEGRQTEREKYGLGWTKEKAIVKVCLLWELMTGSEVTLQGSCLHSVRSKAAEEMGLETGAEDCGSIPHPRVWRNQWPLRKQQELIYDNGLRTEHTPVRVCVCVQCLACD